jgi:hypothetical protein
MTELGRKRRKAGPEQVSEFLQLFLRIRGLARVGAVPAARWLDAVGILRDSRTRPGKPLRDLLRAQRIVGRCQEPNGRWFIGRAKSHDRE